MTRPRHRRPGTTQVMASHQVATPELKRKRSHFANGRPHGAINRRPGRCLTAIPGQPTSQFRAHETPEGTDVQTAGTGSVLVRAASLTRGKSGASAHHAEPPTWVRTLLPTPNPGRPTRNACRERDDGHRPDLTTKSDHNDARYEPVWPDAWIGLRQAHRGLRDISDCSSAAAGQPRSERRVRAVASNSQPSDGCSVQVIPGRQADPDANTHSGWKNFT
jgi:hypothetical protein